MRILVDRREGPFLLEMAKDVVAGLNRDIEEGRLRGVEPFEAARAELELGDLLIVRNEGGGVAIERKTVADFVRSIRDNRLWEQLLRFARAEKVLGAPLARSLLVVHGSFSEYLDTLSLFDVDGDYRRFWSSVLGAFQEALWVYGVPPLVAESDEALEALLRNLLKREAEGANDSSPEARWFRDWRKRKWEAPTKDDRRLLLSAIPLIGEEVAGALLEHFGSLQAVAQADEKALLKVPGIGKERARRIHQIFR
ncbi:MAG: helix-hairpin-helix domain-containing protein [Halobacteria archaeon]